MKLALILATLTACVFPTQAKPLKVFILAGQSNMEGHAKVETFDYIGDDAATAPMLKEMRSPDGKPRVCEKVWISYFTGNKGRNGEGFGKLTSGYGARSKPAEDGGKIGPEFTFGIYTAKAYDGPILIIKTAWGGKSLNTDFRPPSAGPYVLPKETLDRWAKFPQGAHGIPKAEDRPQWLAEKAAKTGVYYRLMIEHVKKVLADPKRVVPDYDAKAGYEIAGFVWFQGWNDMCDGQTYPNRDQPGGYAEYSRLMACFIRDVRKELNVPRMPFVIGVIGVKGDEATGGLANLRPAMAAPAEMPEFKGTVAAVQTAPYWDKRLGAIEPKFKQVRRMPNYLRTEHKNYANKDGKMTKEQQQAYLKEYQAKLVSPEEEALWKRGASNGDYHYLGCAKTLALIGKAFAETLPKLEEEDHPDYTCLAPTPPMGWSSWNAFGKDIDEIKIKAIADAMVSSGMRDAGYIYLIIDESWAKERDENARLVGDRVKFPSGMTAIGDYIHSKGLKYGIYQDRGRMTCAGMPGSLGHEQIDMETFAALGVDYVKIDSCFAEANGQLSSEGYALYRKCINATGRPMILSILDFGNAAWAWGGKESAQLWRTGGDIYPWMGSVYNCGEASGGSLKSHPAFNGLWQFAGPGHWSDPDMLEVGNIKIADEKVRESANKAHFGLWCILAAPLLAGNDLPKMTDTVRDILTAPEVIAVNQDKRGVQGYKVFVDGKLEVYNKPLADGTTAVLLLNKGGTKADITVKWEMIGLSGKQPVRDLWERKDLGLFTDSFTAKGIGEHGNMMLKIGTKGKPLPTAPPVPLEKYTITRPGVTSLSDLYYAWRDKNAPIYNKTFGGDPIKIDGKTFEKGFGCKSKTAFMFAGTERANRFKGVVALDESYQGENEGRFRIFNEDFFGNRVIWDSGKMTKDTPAKEIDVELKGYRCLMLIFEGRNTQSGKPQSDILGVWGDPRVVAND